MTTLELIRKRRSVRSFDGEALSPETRQEILRFAEKLENPWDIPIQWKLLDAKQHGLTSPVIVGTELYMAGKLRRVPHAEEAFGYSFEKVLLFAQSLGLGATWIAGTMNRSAFEQAMRLSEDEVMPCVSPLGRPAEKMSLRESLMRKGVKADSRLDFEKLFFDGSFDKPLTREAAGPLADALEAVRLAPSAVNRQPWRVLLREGFAHFYEKRSKGMENETGDVQKVDLGIALCHFELAAREGGLFPLFRLSDPGIPTEADTQYIASYQIQ